MKKVYLLFLILLISVNMYAQNLHKVNLVKSNDKYFLNAELDQNISSEIFELLHNGVKVTMLYTIKIYKERPFYLFVDSNIKTVECVKMATFNYWKRMYYVSNGTNNVKIKRKQDLNSKLKKIENIFLVHERDLGEGRYYLRIRASLESVEMLPPLGWFFDWLNVGKFQTPWVEKVIKQ